MAATSVTSKSSKRRLKTVLGNYAHTAAIKSGTLASNTIEFDFVEYTPVWDGFDDMVRHQAFDVCEMAAVTYLLAMAHGKPMALLPAAMVGRFQHPHAVTLANNGVERPADLNGKRVGVRSITTTTGAWLRGIIANDHGVDLGSIDWVTAEEPHVAECEDRTRRAPVGRRLVDLMLDGELDAVLGESCDDPRARTLYADPRAEAARWYRAHGVVPINHLVVVSTALLESEPGTVREVYRLLQRGKSSVPAGDPDPIPFGIEANRPALEMLAGYAFQLGLVPKRYTADEMFAPVRDVIG